MSSEKDTTLITDDETGEVIEIEFVDDGEPVVEAVEPESEAPANEESELRKEVDHLREMYLRKLAEFDNFRKRTEREKEELERTAGEAIVLDLIPVLDNFERALEHASEADPEVFRKGVEMISKQLLDVLGKRGLEQFDPQGQAFQPEFHEAVQRVNSPDHAPGTVAWVLARGYRFGGRLVRPAMVGVSMDVAKGSQSEQPAADPTDGDAS